MTDRGRSQKRGSMSVPGRVSQSPRAESLQPAKAKVQGVVFLSSCNRSFVVSRQCRLTDTKTHDCLLHGIHALSLPTRPRRLLDVTAHVTEADNPLSPTLRPENQPSQMFLGVLSVDQGLPMMSMMTTIRTCARRPELSPRGADGSCARFLAANTFRSHETHPHSSLTFRALQRTTINTLKKSCAVRYRRTERLSASTATFSRQRIPACIAPAKL